MLNCIAEATGTFIPVSSLLLDMLEMKELRGRPDGVGKAVNLFSVKQVCFLAIYHFTMEHTFRRSL
jgi:nucleolar complex protein 2